MDATNKPRMALMAVLIFFAVFEIGARVGEWISDPELVDHGLGFHGELDVFESPGDGTWRTRPAKTVSFRDQQFAVPAPSGTLRVMVVGGSSVYNLAPFRQEFEDAVQQAGNFDAVEMVNLGGNSYGSRRLRVAVAHSMMLDPDVVVLYTGHNEEQELHFAALAGPGPSPLNLTLASWSGAFRLMSRRVNQVKGAAVAHGYLDPPEGETLPQETLDKTYQDNINHMVQTAEQAGAQVVIAIPVGNLIRPWLTEEDLADVAAGYAISVESGRERALSALEASPERAQVRPHQQQILRAVSASRSLPLADVAHAVADAEPNGVPGETLFSDHCHLNDAGNRVWIAAVAPVVARAARQDPGRQDPGRQDPGRQDPGRQDPGRPDPTDIQ